MRFFGKGKCELTAIVRIFGMGKCKLIANFSATMMTSLPSISLSLSLCISLSHRAYLTHNIGSASALPIIFLIPHFRIVKKISQEFDLVKNCFDESDEIKFLTKISCNTVQEQEEEGDDDDETIKKKGLKEPGL